MKSEFHAAAIARMAKVMPRMAVIGAPSDAGVADKDAGAVLVHLGVEALLEVHERPARGALEPVRDEVIASFRRPPSLAALAAGVAVHPVHLARSFRRRFGCTVGGMIGTNASGIHSLRYGSIIDNLLEVRIITSSGKPITLPAHNGISKKILKLTKPEVRNRFPNVSKNSCGYRIDKINSKNDFQKIIAGSEGTLGVVISAKLRTFRIPRNTMLIIISYKKLMQAVLDVPSIIELKPSAVELTDKNIVRHIKTKIPEGVGCMLFVEFDDNLARNKESIRGTISGRIIKIITHPQMIKKWWDFRSSALSHSLRSISEKETMPTLIEDATVPVEKLPDLLELIDKIALEYDLRLIIYGHAGNGNLHIRPVLKRKDKRIIQKIASEFFTGVVNMGGSITGEHGDGLARSEFVKLQYGNDIYSIFKQVKHIFDPANILNPGKIISHK